MFSKGPLDQKDNDSSNAEDTAQELESNLQPIDPSIFADGSEPGEVDVPVRVDLDAILAANTSQIFAIANEASEGEKEAFDPFEPATAEPVAEEEAAAEAEPEVVVEAEPEPEPEVEVEPEADQAPEEPAVEETPEEEAPASEEPASELAATSESSAYSRENATYEHRTGWRSLSTGKKAAMVIILVLAILLGIAGGVGFALFKNAQDQLAVDDTIQDALTPTLADIDPYWMLVLGSDSRAEDVDRARSDVLMLVRIDPQTPKVTMVSIPRDTKVYIEGYGTQKINAAYAFGGAELAIKTVESYSGVKISHYAEIYFSGLEDLVDQLGGITVDVPEHCKYSDVELQPGVQTLTGHEALIFARCRKTYSEGDFTRTKCQRILLEALVEKILAKPVTELPEVITNTAKCFSTDIPLADLVTLAQKMQSSGDTKFYSAMAPSTTGMVDGVSYTFTYINQWKFLMQRAANGEDPTITEKEAEILGLESTAYNDMDMTSSIPEETMAALQTYWDEEAAKKAEEEQKAKEKAEKAGSSEKESKSGE